MSEMITWLAAEAERSAPVENEEGRDGEELVEELTDDAIGEDQNPHFCQNQPEVGHPAEDVLERWWTTEDSEERGGGGGFIEAGR